MVGFTRWNSTVTGYVVEWCWTGPAEVEPPFKIMEREWSLANYNVSSDHPDKYQGAITPRLSESFDDPERTRPGFQKLATYGLADKEAAEAIMACQKTLIPPDTRKHVKWRIAEYTIEVLLSVSRPSAIEEAP